MKKLKSILLLVLLASNVLFTEAQETYANFEGGEQAIREFIAKNSKYPLAKPKDELRKRVAVRFVIEADGSIGEVVVLRGANEKFDAEAIRIVKSMPKWIPATQLNKAVRSYWTLPIFFKEGEEKVDVDSVHKAFLDSISMIDDEVFLDTLPINDDRFLPKIYPSLPTFEGGDEALFRFIADSLKYPVTTRHDMPEGKVLIRFVIDEKGNVYEPTVFRSLHPLLDAEVLRVVKSMPKWKPAMLNGKAVISEVLTLPIVFKESR